MYISSVWHVKGSLQMERYLAGGYLTYQSITKLTFNIPASIHVAGLLLFQASVASQVASGRPEEPASGRFLPRADRPGETEGTGLDPTQLTEVIGMVMEKHCPKQKILCTHTRDFVWSTVTIVCSSLLLPRGRQIPNSIQGTKRSCCSGLTCG